MHYLLLCRSLTYAQRVAKLLERKGITGTVAKAPKISADQGCSYCVRVSGRSGARAAEILRDAALAPERVYRMDDDLLTEVSL